RFMWHFAQPQQRARLSWHAFVTPKPPPTVSASSHVRSNTCPPAVITGPAVLVAACSHSPDASAPYADDRVGGCHIDRDDRRGRSGGSGGSEETWVIPRVTQWYRRRQRPRRPALEPGAGRPVIPAIMRSKGSRDSGAHRLLVRRRNARAHLP